jgi:hypothetical protein
MESATNIKQVIGFSEHASPAQTDGKIIAAKPPIFVDMLSPNKVPAGNH